MNYVVGKYDLISETNRICIGRDWIDVWMMNAPGLCPSYEWRGELEGRAKALLGFENKSNGSQDRPFAFRKGAFVIQFQIGTS
jgi:hypothetical protein